MPVSGNPDRNSKEAAATPPPSGMATAHDDAKAGLTPSDATILSVNNIEVVYNHVILVLKGVSLEVPRGSIVALLGAYGAGKTTTLKAVSTLLHAERGEVSKGSIHFDGIEMFGHRSNRWITG